MSPDDGVRRDGAASAESDERGHILAFPVGGRDRGSHERDESWTFTTEVHSVDGLEGQWLRRELGHVIRDLLLWARDDMHAGTGPDDEEERQAA